MDVRQVLRRHEDELLSRPNVTGVGTGVGPSGEQVIVVYLRRPDAAAGPAEALPAEIEGVPVRVIVTGEITAE